MAALRKAALLVGSLVAFGPGCAAHDGLGTTDPADTAPSWGYSGESLCTEARDPSGEWCDPQGKLSSQQAFELVRDKVPDLPVLAVSTYGDELNPDGLARAWVFAFDIGDPEQVLAVRVSGDGSEFPEPVTSGVPTLCEKRPTLDVFDSERLVPHAVLRVEERTGRPFTGQLRMRFGHCSDRPESNIIQLGMGEPPSQFYFARYWGDGRFIELAGPCDDDLFVCLEGR